MDPSHANLPPHPIAMDWRRGSLRGAAVRSSTKYLHQLSGLFASEAALQQMPPETVAYRVTFWEPVAAGTEGGLFWGVTALEPGTVGGEYFMTHGHFHRKRDRCEYYAAVSGTGMLLLMDEDRNTRVEPMAAGSLHFIPGHTAHRVVNTGIDPLVFWACWPSDAGHDYQEIASSGFSLRVFARHGQPEIVAER